MRVYMIRHKPTGRYTLKSFPKLAKEGAVGRVYEKRSHAQSLISGQDYRLRSDIRCRELYPQVYERYDPISEDDPRDAKFWEVVEFELTEVTPQRRALLQMVREAEEAGLYDVPELSAVDFL